MLDASRLTPETLRPLRRVEYDRMVELGMFEDERIELLAGQLVRMSPIGTGHAESVSRLLRLLITKLGARAEVRGQSPFALDDESEPEPDIAVLPPGDYSHAHPSEAWLLVEVAESSLRKDRLIKAALYAAAGVPEYWIVDLAGRAVEVYREPRGETYAAVSRHDESDTLPLQRLPDVELTVAAILPSRR